MPFSSIVIYLDAEPASLEGLHYAAELVTKSKGRLIGVFVSLPVNTYRDGNGAGGFSRGSGANVVAQQMNDDDRYASDALRKTLAKIAQTAGVDYEFRILPFHADLQAASQHARYADLSILRAPDFIHAERNPYGWSSADLVLAAGTPCILVPTHSSAQSSFKRVAIAWDASREARRVVADATYVLKMASEVTIIVVDAHSHSEGHGEEPGADIAMHLSHHGVQANVHIVEAHHQEPGKAIVDQAKSLDAQLLVMGAYGHSRLASIVLGSTTRYVIERCNLPLFLSH